MLLFVLAQAAAAAVQSAAPPPAPLPVEAVAVAAQPGVTSYPPAFFVDAHPNTALDMIQRLPGFSLDTGSGVRGYEGSAGNVLIDGQRPASKTEGIDQLLYRLPADQVLRIDVIRGGAPGIDMQGKTVIANVIRKSGGGAHGLIAASDTADTDGRGFWSARAEGSGQVGDRSWEAGVNAGKGINDGLGDGPRTEVDANGQPLLLGHIHSQGNATQEVATGAVETPLAGGRLRVNGRLFGQAYDQNEFDTITFPDQHTEHEHDDDNIFQSELGARYNRDFGKRASIELVALRQDNHELSAADFRAPDDAQLFRLDNTTAESILRGVLKFQQSPTLSGEAGVEGALNTLDSITTFTENGVAVALPAADVSVEEKRVEAFAKAVWRPLASLTIEGALHEEGSKISSSGDVVLSKTLYYTKPRLLVTWAFNPDTQIRVRLEREVGQLDFSSFVASQQLSVGVVTAGNPNLVPQQDWASEVAIERRFLGAGDLTLTVRHLQITDVVDTAPFNGFDAPANIGSGTEDDVALSLTLPLDKLGLKGGQFRAASTWRSSEVTDPTTGAKREITAQHPIDWELHFAQPIGKFNYGVDISGGVRQTYYRFEQIESIKVNPYVTPFVEWKPKSDLTLRLEVDDATARGFKYTFDNFNGARINGPPASVEERVVHPGQSFSLNLRKTFGS